MSDHKFQNKSGYPTFWHHIIDALNFKTDVLTRPNYTNAFEDPVLKNKQPSKRVICSNCESHLGFEYDDGPLPFNTRIQINDAALVFEKKPWFEIPLLSKKKAQDIKLARIETEKAQ